MWCPSKRVTRDSPGESRQCQTYAVYTGAFDQSTFQKACQTEFAGVPKFNTASMPDLLFLLGKVGADPRITDIRWSAYILATAFIESSHTVRITKQTVDKKGRVKTHKIKVWRNFAPIEETGHGKRRKYSLAVKVKRLPNGDAQVTEYDGEQWVVSAATGKGSPLHRHQRLGVRADSKPSNLYDDGDEQFFFWPGVRSTHLVDELRGCGRGSGTGSGTPV